MVSPRSTLFNKNLTAYSDNGCAVFSVGYRLAPANKYPAAVDDCFEALEYMWKNAESLKINRNLIFVAGLSA